MILIYQKTNKPYMGIHNIDGEMAAAGYIFTNSEAAQQVMKDFPEKFSLKEYRHNDLETVLFLYKNGFQFLIVNNDINKKIKLKKRLPDFEIPRVFYYNPELTRIIYQKKQNDQRILVKQLEHQYFIVPCKIMPQKIMYSSFTQKGRHMMRVFSDMEKYKKWEKKNKEKAMAEQELKPVVMSFREIKNIAKEIPIYVNTGSEMHFVIITHRKRTGKEK